MSLLGFDALGRLALGQITRNAQTTTQLVAASGSFAFTGTSISFNVIENVAAGAYSFTGVSVAFRVAESVAPGAFAFTGVAASFKVTENVTAGSFTFTGNPIFEETFETVTPGAFTFTGYPAQLSRSGADFDLVYGGVGHYLEELEKKRQLAKITRKTPAPIDRTTRPVFAPIGRPQVSAPAPGPDLAAIQNQRMADEMRASAQAATAKRRRQEMEMILLIA